LDEERKNVVCGITSKKLMERKASIPIEHRRTLRNGKRVTFVL